MQNVDERPATAEPASPGWRLAIPSAVTLASVACAAAAVYAIATMGWDPATGAAAHPEHLARAAWLIVLAWFFDSIDGTVARLARATSAFGLQLDSLADAMSFGAAPALMVAVAGGGTPWSLGAGLVFLLAAVVRVARYNVEKAPVGESPLYFRGLATPGSGVAVATWVLFMGYLAAGRAPIGWVDPATGRAIAQAMAAWLPAYALGMSVLMVSTLPFADMPKHYMRRVKPWYQPAAAALLCAAIAPEPVLAAGFVGYVLSGLRGIRGPSSRR